MDVAMKDKRSQRPQRPPVLHETQLNHNIEDTMHPIEDKLSV